MKQRFDSLTGLKGLFSLVIVFFHTLPATPLIQKIPLSSFISNYGGTLGNCFFFVSSGFLMAIGYRDRISRGEISLGAYLSKRLRKLYPLYLITNFVSLAVNTVTFGPSAIEIKRILFTVLLQNGGGLSAGDPYNGPSWFISALVVCYLLFFFAAFYGKNPTGYRCMIGFGIIWGYSIVSGQWTMPFGFAHHGISLFAFFSGCALAEIWPVVARRNDQIIIAAVLGIAGFLMMRYGVDIIAGDFSVAASWLICPGLICLAILCKPFSLLLNSRPIRGLGKISFSVYLWHFVIYDCFRYTYAALFPSGKIREPQYLLYLILTGIICILSHKYLENRSWIRSSDKVSASY